MLDDKQNSYAPANSERFSVTDAVDTWSESIRTLVRMQLRMIQLISASLLAGVCGYGVFVLYQKWAPQVPLPIPNLTALISMSSTALLVGIGAAFSEIGYPYMRKAVANESDDNAKFLTACKLQNTRTIISLALREGAGMYCLFEFSQSRSMIAFSLAVALIVSMVITIPTWSIYTRKILRII